MSKPILCLDFDGVLHAYTSGWKGADVVADGPVPGAMRFLSHATKSFDVYVYSSRSRHEGGITAMQDAITQWSRDEGISDLVPFLTFSHEKPAAFLTIDDRAVCFDGTFPDIPSLLSFKPWNKREV